MDNHLEIERKFLLKGLPKNLQEAPKIIDQCYVWEDVLQNHIRYRGERGQDGVEIFYTTIKTPVEGEGSGAIVNDEQEEEILKEDFVKQYRASEKKLSKIRYIVKHKGLTWEIDKFMNMDLVVAEIELDSEDQEFEMPDEIRDVLIMEVSEHEEFKNYNLADSME